MNKLFSGIGSKIIFPYLLLTLIVAGIGAFIIVSLVTGTLQERFNNQLLDSGRVVAESMVGFEEDRLAVLRQVAFTEGVAESLANNEPDVLVSLVPQIIINSPTDSVIILDDNGRELFAWQRFENAESGQVVTDTDLSQIEEVRLVLEGFTDDYGDKRVFLAETPAGPMLYTVGPIFLNEEQVGAALIGTAVRKMAVSLTENAVARVTLYDQGGNVIATTLGNGRDDINDLLHEPPSYYPAILRMLAESPNRYQVVSENAELQVPLRQIEVLNQDYQLAFGDWRLRNESFGLFSVALPSNFIVSAAATSRNLLNIVFTIATIAVITVGFLVARNIVRPLNRLVDVTTAVTEGNLSQRTGIASNDEIGTLAGSFDTMTERLDERNRQLVAQKSELAAILHSIADGVIVLDNDNHIVNSNPAAQQMIADIVGEFSQEALNQLLNENVTPTFLSGPDNTERYEMNERVLSASSAILQTPEGDQTGTVMVLRDITHEAEAENRKDDFITSMSHELRTPLTVVKVYGEMLQRTANGHLDAQQYAYLDKINKASNELEMHIQKMISISEIQAGSLNLKKQSISLSEQIKTVTDQWQKKMEAKELSFLVQIPDSELPVLADGSRLQWALDNLLSNSFNYTEAGGTVQVIVHRETDQAIIEVIDSGIGIAAADQPYIFNRFFRARNDINYGERGIGLGLYITKEIIELHNGHITLESKSGVGSTFRCELPLVSETAVIQEPV